MLSQSRSFALLPWLAFYWLYCFSWLYLLQVVSLTELLTSNSPIIAILILLFAAVLIAVFGIRMTYLARELADATGLGQAFMGAVFIGATTSLSGIIASATAAWHGDASIAVSNSLGGIAAQTVFLVLADFTYRKANLEFAAASAENLLMSAQLLLLLCLLNIAFVRPDFEFFAIHPISIGLVLVYLFTVKLLAEVHEKPMWIPRMTPGTIKEKPKVSSSLKRNRSNHKGLIFEFGFCALAVGVAGWLAATSGISLVGQTGISGGIVGGVFIAIVTSLPELVVAVTAVRMGALALAVGDIVGGNAFDTLVRRGSGFFLSGRIRLRRHRGPGESMARCSVTNDRNFTGRPDVPGA